jgi:flagellar biosynthesis/type III secretory pathway M-ring protein FliF/YscJ
MVYFYRSPMAIVISALCSIAIAAFIYFVIVKPETDKANSQVDHALKQAQPQIDAANRQFKNAQPSINRAQKIQNCVLAAGTDPAKLAACNK